jgi:ABC-type dipeptide/oligopeptide/nickel transport system permease component
MLAYILKRFLLMFPTLLGVLLLTFVVVQFVLAARWSSTWPRPRRALRAAAVPRAAV